MDGSYIVWRKIGDNKEIVVTNLMIDGDIQATQAEIDAWYEAGNKKIRQAQILLDLEQLDKKRIRAFIEGGFSETHQKPWLEVYNDQIAALREEYNAL